MVSFITVLFNDAHFFSTVEIILLLSQANGNGVLLVMIVVDLAKSFNLSVVNPIVVKSTRFFFGSCNR